MRVDIYRRMGKYTFLPSGISVATVVASVPCEVDTGRDLLAFGAYPDSLDAQAALYSARAGKHGLRLAGIGEGR